ncbi:MAG: universal stress protein [Alcanivoracaceae bacterium]|nr:universal stress protein [Alcanivoracaceae bacterium]
MEGYTKILVAIDCSDDTPALLRRAASLSTQKNSIHLIHVIEPLALAYGADVPMDVSELQHNLTQRAQETAIKYADEFDIPHDNVFVELGSIEKAIQDKADKLEAELIIVGSHTRTGWAVLLGSTAKGLVPGAHCDVLAVKIEQHKS